MNVNFEYSKTLAGEGAVMLLLSLVPYVGWVLGIVGVVLLLKGMKELSLYYQDEKIYQNSWKGVKYYIVALVAAAVAIVAMVIGVASATGFTFAENFVFTAGFGAGLAAFLAGIVVAFVFYVLAATHLRRTFNTLAEKSGEKAFSTAGDLLWYGSIFTILLVGFIMIFIAWIYTTIGFFSMKSRQYQQYPQQPNGSTPPPSAQLQQGAANNQNNSVQPQALGVRGI